MNSFPHLKKYLIIFSILILIILFIYRLTHLDISPTDTSDLVPVQFEVSESENAFPFLEKAGWNCYWPKDFFSVYIKKGKGIKKIKDMVLAENILNKNKEALFFLNKGLSQKVCQFPEIGDINTSLPYLGKFRLLSSILNLKIEFERQNGKFSESVKTCHDLVKLGKLFLSGSESLIHYMVGTAIMQKGLKSVRSLTYSSQITKKDLIKFKIILENLEPFELGLQRGIKGEFQMAKNTIKNMKKGKFRGDDFGIPNYQINTFLFRPNQTIKSFAQIYRTMLKKSSNFFKDLHLEMPEEMENPDSNKWKIFIQGNFLGDTLKGLLIPSANIIFEKRIMLSCDLSATKLIIAIKLFNLDHQKLPSTLNELIPEYLVSIPIDFYDGKPFRYNPNKKIVYSISRDLIDSDGSKKFTDPKYKSEYYNRWKSEDAVYSLEKPLDH